MVLKIRRLTVEEFDEFVNLPQNADKLFEYIRGRFLKCRRIHILLKLQQELVPILGCICLKMILVI